jgi:hypothetical protein
MGRVPAVVTRAIPNGRHRARACGVGIEPRTVEWSGEGDPARFVLLTNLHRRHLDDGQLAIIAAKIATLSRGIRPMAEPHRRARPALQSVSHRSVERARILLDHGSPEEIRQWSQVRRR